MGLRKEKSEKSDLEAILLPQRYRKSRKQPFLSSSRRDSRTVPPRNLLCVGGGVVSFHPSPGTQGLLGRARRLRGNKQMGPRVTRGPEGQGGKPAQEHAGPGPEARCRSPRPGALDPYHRLAAGDKAAAQDCSSSLERVFRPLCYSGACAWRRFGS